MSTPTLSFPFFQVLTVNCFQEEAINKPSWWISKIFLYKVNFLLFLLFFPSRVAPSEHFSSLLPQHIFPVSPHIISISLSACQSSSLNLTLIPVSLQTLSLLSWCIYKSASLRFVCPFGVARWWITKVRNLLTYLPFAVLPTCESIHPHLCTHTDAR